MEKTNRETAEQHMATAIRVFQRTNELRLVTARKYGKADVPYLTQDQFEEGGQAIETALLVEFPNQPITVDYMIGMVWNMGYWR